QLDEVFEVTARTERTACAGEDDRACLRVLGEVPPHRDERSMQCLVRRVQRLLPVERHDADRALRLDQQLRCERIVHRPSCHRPASRLYRGPGMHVNLASITPLPAWCPCPPGKHSSNQTPFLTNMSSSYVRPG